MFREGGSSQNLFHNLESTNFCFKSNQPISSSSVNKDRNSIEFLNFFIFLIYFDKIHLYVRSLIRRLCVWKAQFEINRSFSDEFATIRIFIMWRSGDTKFHWTWKKCPCVHFLSCLNFGPIKMINDSVESK